MHAHVGRRFADHDLLAPAHRRRGPRLAVGVALSVVALLVLGVVIGRAMAPPGPAAPTPPEDAAAVGPTRVVSGVPVGYARSEEGAVAAAANYTVVLGSKANLDPTFGDAAYPVFTLPAAGDELLRESRGFAATLEDPAALAADPSVVLHAAPLGYRVESYTDDEATVSIWYVAVGVGTPELPMTTGWATDRVTLRWSDDDWKASSFVGETGPEPPDGLTVTQDADLVARINGFEPFVYQPGAQS